MNDSTHLWMSPTEFVFVSGLLFSFINSIFDILFSKKNASAAGSDDDFVHGHSYQVS